MSKSKKEALSSIDDSYPIQVGYYFIEEQFRLLSGKILTFIDMAITDPQANKAWKDTVKQEFYKRIQECQGHCSGWSEAHSVDLNPNTTARLA